MNDKDRDTGSFALATVLVVSGFLLGAFAGGVLGNELARDELNPTGTSAAFFNGLLTGAGAGTLAGALGYGAWRRRQKGLPPRQLSPADAAGKFRARMAWRRGAALAVWAGGLAYVLLGRDRPVGESLWFGVLVLIGSVGFALYSRCPACDKFLSTASIRSKRCERCATSLAEG